MPAKRVCVCEKKKDSGASQSKPLTRTSSLQTFDRIEWLRKRVLPGKLIDRTVRLKYLVHPSEMNEHLAIKKVFKRFDEDHNSQFFVSSRFENQNNRKVGSGRSETRFRGTQSGSYRKPDCKSFSVSRHKSSSKRSLQRAQPV